MTGEVQNILFTYYKFYVFDNKVTTKIFGPKKDEQFRTCPNMKEEH
jgi:hypothetical protein